MKYTLDLDASKKMAEQEVSLRKKPLKVNFAKAFALFALVMVIGLVVGYMAYVKFGIYSTKNLLCFRFLQGQQLGILLETLVCLKLKKALLKKQIRVMY